MTTPDAPDMPDLPANEQRSSLTFVWPQTTEARPVSFALLGFIALSVLIHAVSFYIFQLAYPPSARINPPPAQVSILAPGSPENNALLHHIKAEDPALVSRPQEVLPANLLDLPYTPSYAQVRAVPKVVDKQPATLAYPPAMDTSALIRSALPRQQPPSQQDPAPRTQLRFSGALAQRKALNDPPKNLTAQSLVELQPARFLIGVSDRGEMCYIFLQHSSGDKALDAQAETYLQQIEFSHASELLTLGFAEFLWGSDAFPHSSP